MRPVALAILLALLAAQAHAQGMGGRRPNGPPEATAPSQNEAEVKKRRAREEAAAKAAMQRIPDSKEKYDAWRIAR
jgi:hypothetical protein